MTKALRKAIAWKNVFQEHLKIHSQIVDTINVISRRTHFSNLSDNLHYSSYF